MSLLRPRPNRRLDRCQSSLPSPFSASLLLSPFSRPSLTPSSLPLPLYIYLPLSLYLFAISLCASPRRVLTANNAPRDAPKTSTSLVAATRKRKRERGAERTELLSTPVRKFISETKSSQRTDSGTSTVALKFSGCLTRSCEVTPVLIYLLDMLNLSNNIKSY